MLVVQNTHLLVNRFSHEQPKGVVFQDFNELDRPDPVLDVCSDALQEVVVIVVIVHKQSVCPVPRHEERIAAKQNHPTAGRTTIIRSSLNKVEFLKYQHMVSCLRI